MTKQEFLAMSLPYGINILWRDGERVLLDTRNIRFIFQNDEFIKPILRPLSDLTTEIEHKGERFVPINRIKESQYHLFFRGDITSPLEGLQFSELRKLIEWHFDIADLISKGEAIDVNTLETNPYK